MSDAVLQAGAGGVFTERFRELAASRSEPGWLASLRRRAMARFEQAGFPGTDDEAWRGTTTTPLAKTAFGRPAAGTSLPSVAAFPGSRIVFVNGRHAPSHDRVAGGAPTATDLAGALASHPDTLESSLGTHARLENHPFAALNTALFEDLAFVTIPPGADLAVPIVIVHAATAGREPVAIHPRTLVVAGPGSRATIVELFCGEGNYFQNPVAEIVVGENAGVEHLRVQAEGAEAFHVGLVHGNQARDGRLWSHALSFGARWSRLDAGSVLDGEGAECHLYGLAIAGGTQHVDHHTFLDHAAAHCPSHELYKGIVSGRARSVFNGRIVVRPGAQKTDAKQSNRNLLIGPDALAFTRPQLEIHADDVRCTHGATVGQLDEEALFYLRARGIGEEAAHHLLMHAFAGEVLDKVKHPASRDAAMALVAARFPEIAA